VEAEEQKEQAPVVLWLQGGPGCGGLYGLFVEHGPFRLSVYTGKVEHNPWSWNRKFNMLYIESPAGVGMSIMGGSSQWNNDQESARENYVFLQGFYELFPEFASNQLWIAGESYGGVYTPMLVDTILKGSDAALASRLTGMTLGNPVIDCTRWGIINNPAALGMAGYYWHAMIPYHLFHDFEQAGCMLASPPNPTVCNTLFQSAPVGVIDGDDKFTVTCVGNGTLDLLAKTPNCATPGNQATAYLNRQDVRDAIHAVSVANQTWVGCGNVNYANQSTDILDFLRSIFDERPNFPTLYYSGDVDVATVPFQYTQQCLSVLNPTVTIPWRPYYIPGNKADIAGYVESYDLFTYVTVKGAGHEVPKFVPATAFHMITSFILNGVIP
jgi:hypothetical protein